MADAATEELASGHSPPDDPGDSSPPPLGEPLPFSSGNPRIEETRGVMRLFPRVNAPTPNDLPVGRKPLVCVLEVPNHMTYADFCQFCGSFVPHMLEIRIVRRDGVEDKYSALVRFDEQRSTDEFYWHFDGRNFSSLEEDACRVLFVVDVQYTASIERAHNSVPSSMEQPSCPVCLDRLDQDTGGILTTICNHSFHCSCISKWTDSSCPVCRYCQQQPEKSICSACETTENLWMCLTCGFVGCGRNKEGHAIRHWKETQHCYSLQLETQRVWDYVGDNYVHRLIQSKTDGKLVELNHHCTHSKDPCSNCECIGDSGVNEALLNSKVEAIVEEYNVLLTSQLESQRNYFESLLLDVEEETDKEISEAIKKALSYKLQKTKLKLDKCAREREFLADLNETLLKNQDMWKTKILEAEAREQKAAKQRDEKINALEEQLRDLMMHMETGKVIDNLAANKSKEVKESIILPIPPAESSSANGNRKTQKHHRRRS